MMVGQDSHPEMMMVMAAVVVEAEAIGPVGSSFLAFLLSWDFWRTKKVSHHIKMTEEDERTMHF